MAYKATDQEIFGDIGTMLKILASRPEVDDTKPFILWMTPKQKALIEIEYPDGTLMVNGHVVHIREVGLLPTGRV